MQIEFVLFLSIAAFVFLFLMLWSDDSWKKIKYGMLSMTMFFVSGASTSIVHKPYTVVLENTQENAMTVVRKGTQEITKNWPLANIFWALGFLCLAMIFIEAVPMLTGWLEKRRTGYRGDSY